MSLRLRLGLTVLVTALLLLYGIQWLRGDVQRRAFEDQLETWVSLLMNGLGGIEQCKSEPERWGGPLGLTRMGDFGPRTRGRPRPVPLLTRGDFRDIQRAFRRPPLGRPTIWAYDAAFSSRNPEAPEFPASLRARLEAGNHLAWESLGPVDRSSERPPGRPREEEPPGELPPERLACALRLETDVEVCRIVLLYGDRRPDPAVGGLTWIPIVLSGGLLLAVLFAAGPIVRRIRLLTEDVRRAAAAHYATPVEVRGRDEIARLAQAFNEASSQIRTHVTDLEKRDETLRSFIGNTTHDVMIPLTVLQGHLATMRRRLEAGQRVEPEILVAALNEAHYMGSIVHNLSAVAKLEAADIEVRSDPVDMNALVDRAVARHRPMATARDIGLDYSVPEAPVMATGDVTLIEQAVSNVIHNAVRYNEAGGHVAVLLEQEEDGFSLLVIDDGPGISDEELARLPERRFRGETARTRAPDGLGLGLHIARDVAKRHGFSLEFRRSEYGGLEVEFRGPLRPAP